MEQDNVVLSGVIGSYQEFRPAPALEGHFRCVWSNALPRDRSNRVAVVPDGCVDITWIDGELVVAGPDMEAARSALMPGGTLIGVRFRPGAARQWLGVPMSEILGAKVPLRDFWGKRASAAAERIGDASTIAERMRVLETALCQLAPDLDPRKSDMGFVFNALANESGGAGMAIILERLDISPRTLRRRCQDAFGYGPKTLERILRFQRFLGLARQAEKPRLADLAFEAGYADQAHLTREVRRLSGFSPATILSQYGS